MIAVIALDNFIINNKQVLSNRLIFYHTRFRSMSYRNLNLLFFVLFIVIFTLIYNDFSSWFFNDLLLHINDNGKDVNIGTNSTINVNNPNVSASISKEGVNNIAAAISAAGGATAGIKVAQHIGGPPGAKIVAGLATMAAVQATTGIMSKVLNNKSNTSDVSKLINLSNTSSTKSTIDQYPLNILYDINLLLYAAVLSISIILNIYLVRYILSIDYERYIPNNKIGNLLRIFLKRYIGTWNKVNKSLLAYSYVLLFLTIIIAKVSFVILNS